MLLKPKTGFVLVCLFLDALGIGLIIPVLPRLIGTLCEARDVQTWWYGAIMLSYGVMQFVSAPFLGSLSDRFGRRPVLLTGILGLGIMFAIPAFFASLPLILASRVVGGAFSANMAVAQAYISDLTQGRTRCAMFGRLGAVFGIGFVLGPALGGILGRNDPTVPFLFASLLSLANFLYGALVLPESLQPDCAIRTTLAKHSPFLALPRLVRERKFRTFVLVLALTTLANCILQCTWALYTEFRYGFTPLEIGLSVFALGLSIAFVQGCALKPLLDHHPASRVVTLSLAASALCLFGIGLVGNGMIAIALCCSYAIAGTVGPILTSAISRAAVANDKGRLIGALSSLGALMGALAPAIGTPLLTFVIDHETGLAAGAPYVVCSFLVLISLGLFLSNGLRELDEIDNDSVLDS